MQLPGLIMKVRSARGVLYNVFSDGTWLPVISGGSGGAGDGTGGAGDGGDGGAGGGDGGSGGAGSGGGAGGAGDGGGRTFTQAEHQAEVDRVAGATRAEERRKAEKDLSEALGCSVEEAKAKLAALDAAETAKLTEVQQREKEATEKDAAAAKREAAAALREKSATVSEMLAAKGLSGDKLTRARKLVLVDLDELPEPKAEEFAAAIAAVEKDVPEVFALKAPVADSDLGGRGPAGGGGEGGDDLEAGRKRAQEEAKRAPATTIFDGLRPVGANQ